MPELSELLQAVNDPESYIYNRVKRGESDAETKLMRDIYSLGYEGTPALSVTQPRGILGSIGESVGLLGPPDPRPLTPYERYIYSQGQYGREKENLSTKTAKFNLSSAETQKGLNALQTALKLNVLTGVSSPEMLSEYPQYADDYAGGLIINKREKAKQDKLDRLKMDEARADYRWKMQGVRGERKTASARTQDERDAALFSAWARGPTGARLLNVEIPKYIGDPKNIMNQKGELGKMEKLTDPVLMRPIIAKWVMLKQQIRQAMLSEGISPEKVDNFIMTLPNYGRLEQDPNLVFGEPSSTRTGAVQIPDTTNAPPDAQQKFMDTLDSYEQGLE